MKTALRSTAIAIVLVALTGIFDAHADCTPANNLVGPKSRVDWVEGGLVYDTTNDVLKTCDGTNWQTVGGGGLSGGTSGYLGVWTGATTLGLSSTTAGQNLFWDATNYRLGIGTTSPTAPLHVAGSAAVPETLRLSNGAFGEGGQITLMDGSGAGGWEIDNNGTGASAMLRIFRDKGVNDLLTGVNITPSGNVGIGLIGPTAKLHVDGDLLLAATLPRVASASYLTLQSGAGQAMTFNTGGASERVRIDATGNVGIGLTTPGAKLTVAGGEIRNQDNSAFYSFYDLTGATRNGYLQITSSDSLLVQQNAAPMRFLTSNAERMRIHANGNIGIGVADPVYGKLTIRGATAAFETPTGETQLEIRAPNDSTTYDALIAFHNPNVMGLHMGLDTSDGNKFKIGGWSWINGVYLTSGNTSWTGISDARLKKKVVEYSVLDRLDKFRAVSFVWKKSGKPDIGVIAQELYEIFPEAVDKGTNDDPEADEGSDGLWGVQYDKLGALALEAAKELKADNDNLRAELDELRSEIEALKSAR